MQYVKKDKLTELLAEKLCARLAASETPRQSRAVSYCLGQLKVRAGWGGVGYGAVRRARARMTFGYLHRSSLGYGLWRGVDTNWHT